MSRRAGEGMNKLIGHVGFVTAGAWTGLLVSYMVLEHEFAWPMWFLLLTCLTGAWNGWKAGEQEKGEGR